VTAMDFEALAQRIGETIERTGNAKAVFGEPVKLATQSVVPVAAVVVQLGGGGGAARLLGGGGGGFNMRVTPIGYIHEKDGVVTFSAIDVPESALRAHPEPAPDIASLVERLARRFREQP